MAYHKSPSGLWLRCRAQSPDRCYYGGSTDAPHSSSQAAIAAEGGGIARHNGKMVQVIPTDGGYLTVAENGQVAVYDGEGNPIPYAERRGSGWDKGAALAEDSEERIRLKEEMEAALIADAALSADRAAHRTQAWRQLTEEIQLKSQEYADAHYGEAYGYGSDEEIDSLHAQRWALIAQQGPAGYSREIAEAEGLSEEDLKEIDLENAKAQAVADKIREEQEELAGKIGLKQLTSSERRRRGWIATKGSKAGRRLAQAAKGKVAAGAGTMVGNVQAAGGSVVSGAQSELYRFRNELGDEIDSFEQGLSTEFGVPMIGAPSSQLLGLRDSPNPAVASAAQAEEQSRRVRTKSKKKAKSSSEDFDDIDGALADALFEDQSSTEDLWDLGDDDSLFDGFDS